MTKTQQRISDFSVLPVKYSSSSVHYIYARPHVNKSIVAESSNCQTLPSDRTLFLVNLPPDATERELIMLFQPYGTVERVVFDFNKDEDHEAVDASDDEESDGNPGDDVDENHDTLEGRRQEKSKGPIVTPLPATPLRRYRKSGRTAHIIFLDVSSLTRSLSSFKIRPWPTSTDSPPIGLAHYTALYSSLRPPLDSIREHADTYMERYEHELAKTKHRSKYRKGEAIIDEDGFTLVTRGGAYGRTLGGGVGVASKQFQSQAGSGGRQRNKKRGKKGKESFYAFQKAEKQRKELMDLKRKWEEDKMKVEKLKASRRFKPY